MFKTDENKQYQQFSHESIRTLLELLEHTTIRIHSTENELPITNLLDALDNEFLLEQMLGQRLSIHLNDQLFHYSVSNDQPEHSLAAACLDVLQKHSGSSLSHSVKTLLSSSTRLQPARPASFAL